MTTRDRQELIDQLRKNGVTRYREGEVELELGPLPGPALDTTGKALRNVPEKPLANPTQLGPRGQKRDPKILYRGASAFPDEG